MTAPNEERCTCGCIEYALDGQTFLWRDGEMFLVDPNCPVHGSRTANDPDAPGPTVESDKHLMHDLGWRSGQSPAPGPAVHHDKTHGYHTADGEPVPGPSDPDKTPPTVESGDVVESVREDLDGGEPTFPSDTVASLVAEIQRLAKCNESLIEANGGYAEENTKLREFFEAVFQEVWDLHDPDGGDLQDTAERLGLLVKVPADEQFKDEYDADEMFVWSWHPLALEGK